MSGVRSSRRWVHAGLCRGDPTAHDVGLCHMHHRIRLAFAVVLEHILLAIQEWVRRKRMVNTSLEHKQLKEKVCRAATRLRSLLSNCSTVVAVVVRALFGW